jgi:hypothetical protein
VKNLRIIKRVTIEIIIFNAAMQFKFVSNDFICKAYCENELHDMKNESNESNEPLGHPCSRKMNASKKIDPGRLREIITN